MSDSTRATPNQPQIGRRAALKAAAAAGAAAVVWSEPTIKGLARRPAYAAVDSTGASVSLAVTITGLIASGTEGPVASLMAAPIPSNITFPALTAEIVDNDGVACIQISVPFPALFSAVSGGDVIAPLGSTSTLILNKDLEEGDSFSFDATVTC